MIPLLTSPSQIPLVECDRVRRAGGDYYTIAGPTWIGATSLFPRYRRWYFGMALHPLMGELVVPHRGRSEVAA